MINGNRNVDREITSRIARPKIPRVQECRFFICSACGPQKLDSSLMQPSSPASTRGAIHRAPPCFGERALPEGDDDGRSSVAMVGLGSECPDQDWREL
jgi:hypothetical protein